MTAKSLAQYLWVPLGVPAYHTLGAPVRNNVVPAVVQTGVPTCSICNKPLLECQCGNGEWERPDSHG